MVQSARRILVVEDEESIGRGLCDVLTFRGHQVTWAKDGNEALRTSTSQAFDLVLLDIMLPELDGYSVCQKLRETGSRVGVIMLTAKGSEDDVLRGFEVGADDYVTTPFSLKQLLARVDAVLSRSLPDVETPFAAGGLTVDPATSTATSPQGSVEVSAREIIILRLLSEEPGRIVSRRVLLRDVWEMPNPDAVETRTVDVHMGKLRKKLAGICSDSIQTVRGQGYRYVPGGGT
jgi:DNA-binding response OmpR family regulator